jgi:hypothetical protein
VARRREVDLVSAPSSHTPGSLASYGLCERISLAPRDRRLCGALGNGAHCGSNPASLERLGRAGWEHYNDLWKVIDNLCHF